MKGATLRTSSTEQRPDDRVGDQGAGWEVELFSYHEDTLSASRNKEGRGRQN